MEVKQITDEQDDYDFSVNWMSDDDLRAIVKTMRDALSGEHPNLD
jgi:hypothetical protein